MAEQKSKEYPLRLLFLREFTKQLITNSTPIIIQETPEEIIQETNKTVREIPSKKSIFDGMIASPKTKILENVMPIPKRSNYMEPPIVGPPVGTIDLGKLNIFLRDPRINQIEVNGPGREVLVRVAGNSQRTKIKLTKEEIQKIMNDFSEKTRIPVIKGVFKTALGGLTLTAVISDFVDTRFTIQKRRPFQKR